MKIEAIISDFSKVLVFSKDQNYTGSLNELYRKNNFNFDDTFDINFELLDFYKSLKNKYRLFLFSQAKENLQNADSIKPLLDEIFERILTTEEVGFSKEEAKAYSKVSEMIDIIPKNLIFIDDQPNRVELAKAVGFHGIVYSSNEQVVSAIRELVN